MNLILISIVINLIHHVLSYTTDQIRALPGLTDEPKFKQYSGYLNGGQDIRLHYWFVESQSNPKSDPIIIWLNGGPGESSLWGMFEENGAFRVGSDGQTVTIDPNSWNTLANVLYLESPVGVGFSYLARNETFKHSDTTSARMNLKAIQDFFKKFPQFKPNTFYITGESYGGVFAPTLALEILKNDPDINLKGVAIGNGWVDSELLKSTGLEYAYQRGLIDPQVWSNITDTNCNCTDSGLECDFRNSLEQFYDSMFVNLYTNGISAYNLQDKLCSVIKYNVTGTFLSRDNGTFFEGCPPDVLMMYLNRDETRKALNIPVDVQKWQGFRWLNYENVFTDKNMEPVIKEIVAMNKLDQFIVYYGDQDMICDFIGGQRFVERLGYPVKDKQKIWRLNGRFGGTVKRFEGITFTTVIGAGHSVPMDRPEAGLAILKELIGIKKLN